MSWSDEKREVGSGLQHAGQADKACREPGADAHEDTTYNLDTLH